MKRALSQESCVKKSRVLVPFCIEKEDTCSLCKTRGCIANEPQPVRFGCCYLQVGWYESLRSLSIDHVSTHQRLLHQYLSTRYRAPCVPAYTVAATPRATICGDYNFCKAMRRKDVRILLLLCQVMTIESQYIYSCKWYKAAKCCQTCSFVSARL